MNVTPSLCRLTPLAAALLLSGCSTVGNLLGSSDSGQPIDYRSQAVKTPSLEVPPDLTQLSREGRFNVQAGQPVSASTFGQPGVAPATVAPGMPAVTPQEVGHVRLVREGESRRLVTTLAPEVVYQRALAFWKEAGFPIEVERPEAGLIETGWAENRAKLPQDFVRSLLGRLADGIVSTGERDRFRTRIERGPQGTEITISHRGLVEGPVGSDKDVVRWGPRPTDPALEAEFVYRLMAKLGAPEAQVQQARSGDGRPAAAGSRPAGTAATPAAADRARLLPDGRIELTEGFDRAWRRVGLGLDRTGFTVEDRDRAGGIYFVRFIDKSGDANPGLFDRVLNVFRSDDSKTRLARYRIVIKGEGDAKSVLSVLNANGQPEASAVVKQMTDLLLKELR